MANEGFQLFAWCIVTPDALTFRELIGRPGPPNLNTEMDACTLYTVPVPLLIRM